DWAATAVPPTLEDDAEVQSNSSHAVPTYRCPGAKVIGTRRCSTPHLKETYSTEPYPIWEAARTSNSLSVFAQFAAAGDSGPTQRVAFATLILSRAERDV